MVTSNLQQQIARVRESLKLKPGETTAPRKGVIRVAKKVTKKVKKVAKKGNGHQEAPEGIVSVADLASEAKINPQSARVKLRSAEVARPEGRWVWKEGSSALKAARKVLGLT